MAIYHLEAKVVSRGAGRSAVAASAYLSCTNILNDYDGVRHDFTRKKGLVWQDVFLPEFAPAEWKDRGLLWNAVEKNEKTKDSRLAREFVPALPIELTPAQWQELLTDFIQNNFVAEGMTQDDIAAGTADRMKNVTDFSVIESNITEIKSILLFFDSLADDLILAHGSLLKFCRRIDEVERLDEAHLLPLALEIFVDHHFTQSGIYISVKKNAKSVTGIVAKRLNFDSYYSLILTDFFEGLHYGHYPRKCEICGKYFLMQSARRQKYCPYGIAPELYRGKKITCRKYAAVLNRKEKAENDPIVSLYNRRCGAIRTEVGRCTISKAFGEAAKHLAKEHKLRALADDQYAKTQYRKDMSREALYAEVDRNLK